MILKRLLIEKLKRSHSFAKIIERALRALILIFYAIRSVFQQLIDCRQLRAARKNLHRLGELLHSG